MDYEYYYYESRNRYYDACSEVTNYENRANELRSQRQQKLSYINQFKADLRKHQNASTDLNTAINKDSELQGDLSKITSNVNLASENFGSMAKSSSVANRSLNSVYSTESSRTKSTLNSIFSTLRNKKTAIDNKVAELQDSINRAESELQDIESGINSANSAASDWRNERWNASFDMEYYRRKMYEEE